MNEEQTCVRIVTVGVVTREIGIRDLQGDALEERTTGVLTCLTLSVAGEPGQRVVALFGELDLASAYMVEDAIVTISDATIALDLQGLTFMDAFGLGTLLRAKRRVEKDGHRLIVCNVHGLALRVLEVTGARTDLLDA
jgi:anti-anti-sigma factor